MNKRVRQAYKKGYKAAIFDVIGCITISVVYASLFVMFW